MGLFDKINWDDIFGPTIRTKEDAIKVIKNDKTIMTRFTTTATITSILDILVDRFGIEESYINELTNAYLERFIDIEADKLIKELEDSN